VEAANVIPLADTLLALVDSLELPEGSGLAITSATLDVPLEGRVVPMRGAPVFLAAVPHTRWRSGVLPAVHLAHFGLAEVPTEDEG